MNVKWRIKVNGKEYGSVDEMPSAERAAYEKALRETKSAGREYNLTARSARIVFNGQEYASVDDMPEEVRRAYLEIMNAVESGRAAPANAPGGGIPKVPLMRRIGGVAASPRGARPIAPESFSARKLVVGALIVALLAAIYLLARR